MVVAVASKVLGMDEDAWLRRVGPMAWQATAADRARLLHGGGRCPQHRWYGGGFIPVEAELCPECVGLVCDLCHVLFVRDASRLAGAPGMGFDSWVRARAKSRLVDVLRARAGELGMVQRLDRALAAGWVRNAVPDPLDRKIVELAGLFARSYDPFPGGGAVWPYERWARRLAQEGDASGMSAVEVAGRLARALEALESTRRGRKFVETNIDRPMSRRLSELADMPTIDGGSPPEKEHRRRRRGFGPS